MVSEEPSQFSQTANPPQSRSSDPPRACDKELFPPLGSGCTAIAGSFVLRIHAVIKRSHYECSSGLRGRSRGHGCELWGHVRSSGLSLGPDCLWATPLARLSCQGSLVHSQRPLRFPTSSWTTAHPCRPPPSGEPMSQLWAGPVSTRSVGIFVWSASVTLTPVCPR